MKNVTVVTESMTFTVFETGEEIIDRIAFTVKEFGMNKLVQSFVVPAVDTEIIIKQLRSSGLDLSISVTGGPGGLDEDLKYVSLQIAWREIEFNLIKEVIV